VHPGTQGPEGLDQDVHAEVELVAPNQVGVCQVTLHHGGMHGGGRGVHLHTMVIVVVMVIPIIMVVVIVMVIAIVMVIVILMAIAMIYL
jgi:hypothetical protein